MKDNEETKQVDDLLIAYKFPPMTDVGGIILAKRALLTGKSYDVVHTEIQEPLDNDFNEIIDEIINNRIIIKNFEYGMSKKELNETFNNYITEGLKKLEDANDNYKTITTRSWGVQPVFLALEYKLNHPECFWTAEFSDPLTVNIENKSRDKKFKLDNKDYADRINKEIDRVNKEKNSKLEHIKEDDNIYLLCEYLAYVFADKIRFINSNQRYIMLKQCPYDVKDLVMGKSEIKSHPTLDEKYYHVKEVDYKVDEDCINIGYFGTYFGKRNFETIFYAYDNLNDDLKAKIKFHLFLNHGDNLKRLTSNLNMGKSLIVNNKVSLLEFLNLSTKLDVLLVNDTETKGNFEKNPYRPSKIADYLGSNNDIWGICEKDSIMDSLEEIKYKSYINDYYSAKLVLNQIIQDSDKIDDELKTKPYKDEDLNDYSINYFNKNMDDLSKGDIEELINENMYLKGRTNHLNHLFNGTTGRGLFADEAKKLISKNEKIEKENEKLKKQNKKYKKELKYLKSSKGSLKYQIKKIIK
ncbi:MAG: hypothetical protein IKV87_03370 [Methanobrevibacter sp.]|nr:hypothetical protein [Methanobrevibacter sp.]